MEMSRKVSFTYPLRGPGRPQILLVGNGLEYGSNQRSWEQLVRDLTLPERQGLAGAHTLPFPLRYELLSTPPDARMPLRREEIVEEERRLAAAMRGMVHQSNALLERLPELQMDHVFTTNYSYCLEAAFLPGRDFGRGQVRSRFRFDLRSGGEREGRKREVQYRLHTGYLCPAPAKGGRSTGLWHIHGESSVPGGIVLGHDRYGRLLARIVACCKDMAGRAADAGAEGFTFDSWPGLFLFGDVYILGFGFDFCEFDLWWLLRRKQREYSADGRVYYYSLPPSDQRTETSHLLLRANGAEIRTAGCGADTDYDRFYAAAIEDIRRQAALRRSEGA